MLDIISVLRISSERDLGEISLTEALLEMLATRSIRISRWREFPMETANDQREGDKVEGRPASFMAGTPLKFES
jgi:hypothetical protein